MEENHTLTLYISYYLSRFNNVGLGKLGYSSWNNAFQDIAIRLKVNEHSVKNWRDEFDPLHGFRKGWHQRPMSPSRVRIVKALENLDEKTIRNIVLEILDVDNSSKQNIEELRKVSLETDSEREYEFIPRGITGKKAEEYFISNYNSFEEFIPGELIDTRDLGTGYDFRIEGEKTIYIEVKGLIKEKGGILLTDKEWNTAKDLKNDYFIVLISNLNNVPHVKIIQNPALIFLPKKNISTSIVINWNVSHNQIINS